MTLLINDSILIARRDEGFDCTPGEIMHPARCSRPGISTLLIIFTIDKKRMISSDIEAIFVFFFFSVFFSLFYFFFFFIGGVRKVSSL